MLIKPLELQKALTPVLRAAHPRAWSDRAPETAVFPYLVYELGPATNDGSTEIFMMDLDGWDVPADGTPVALETMMAAANQALDRTTIAVNGQLAFSVYLETRLRLEEDDARIHRRRYVYQIRTHTGGA